MSEVWAPLRQVQHNNRGETRARASFDAACGWFSGHFPEMPILPGVALLELVARMAQLPESQPVQVVGFRRVRFARPVHPGETIELTLTPEPSPEQVCVRSFTVQCGGALVCRGIMDLSTATSPP